MRYSILPPKEFIVAENAAKRPLASMSPILSGKNALEGLKVGTCEGHVNHVPILPRARSLLFLEDLEKEKPEYAIVNTGIIQPPEFFMEAIENSYTLVYQDSKFNLYKRD